MRMTGMQSEVAKLLKTKRKKYFCNGKMATGKDSECNFAFFCATQNVLLFYATPSLRMIPFFSCGQNVW
jgi:hypothetical protein